MKLIFSKFVSSVALAVLLLISHVVPANEAGWSTQGPINLAQSSGDDAYFCVSVDEGDRSQTYTQYFVTNNCGHSVLFRWYVNGGRHCERWSNGNEYPCAVLVRGGGRNVVRAYKEGLTFIYYIATFL